MTEQVTDDWQEALERCLQRLGATVVAQIIGVSFQAVYSWRGKNSIRPIDARVEAIKTLAASLDEAECPLAQGWKLCLIHSFSATGEVVLMDPKGKPYGSRDRIVEGDRDLPAWVVVEQIAIVVGCPYHALVGKFVAPGLRRQRGYVREA